MILSAAAGAVWPAAGPAIVRSTLPAPSGGVNHGAAVAETPSGEMLACWYSGRHEEDRSVRILCAQGASDGRRWSAPWTAVAPGERAIGGEAPNKSLGNVTLAVAPDGRIWMIYGVIQSRAWPIIGEVCRNWNCGRIDARFSTDEGRAWSPARRLVDVGGALPRAAPKRFRRWWLLPFYLENEQQSAVALVSLEGAAPAVKAVWPLPGQRLIQPTLVAERDGRFRVFFRDPRRQAVYTARLDPTTGRWRDIGRTNLPNPGSAVDAFTDGLGRYLVAYNPSTANRDVLALARSADGVHFVRGCSLSLAALETGAAYPSVIRGRDGAWRIVYSAAAKSRIAFVRFDADWLAKCFAAQG